VIEHGREVWYLTDARQTASRGAEVSTAFLGRGLVLAGIVAGLLAVSLPFADETRYVDDGTTAAFLIMLLSFTSFLPAEIGRDLVAAAAGSAAFGFFLVIPSIYAFDSFGRLESGAWLGVCTGLIPLGALLVFAAEGAPTKTPAVGRGPSLLVATVGLVLVAVGIWLELGHGGPTYWNASSSGHAAGLLLILLVLADSALLAGAAHSSARVGDLVVLTAAATFGFTVFAVVAGAFDDFGTLGAGAWVEACGGALLLGGVGLPRLLRHGSPASTAAAVA
jgi:hypothetical protein